MRAAKSYQDIVDALANATEAAQATKTASEETYRTAYPDDGSDSLLTAAQISKNASLALADEATNLAVQR